MSGFNDNWGGKGSGKGSGFNFRSSSRSKGSQKGNNKGGEGWKGYGKGSNVNNDGSFGSFGTVPGPSRTDQWGNPFPSNDFASGSKRRVSFADATKPFTVDDVPISNDDDRAAGDGNARDQSSSYSADASGSGRGNYFGRSGGDAGGRPPLPTEEYRRRMAFEERSKFSGNMITTSDADIRAWVLNAMPEIRDNGDKVDGAVVTLRKLMPLFNMARNGFNPDTWKFMNRYMVKCFCTDAEMESEGVPEFFLWIFRALFGYRGPRPLFDNDLLLIDFFLNGTFKNMITHELAHNPGMCGGSKIIAGEIEELRKQRRESAAAGESHQSKSVNSSESKGKRKAVESVVDMVTPENQISSAELRQLKKLMMKFNSLDDDNYDDDGKEKEKSEDSPIVRRRSGKLKRRRNSKGGLDE